MSTDQTPPNTNDATFTVHLDRSDHRRLQTLADQNEATAVDTLQEIIKEILNQKIPVEKKVQISLNIPEDTLARVDERVAKMGLTRAGWIKTAIYQALVSGIHTGGNTR